MSTSSISNLGSYLQSILGAAPQRTDPTSATKPKPAAVDPASLRQQPDSAQLSPFAQLMNTLQQLQQSDPSKYQQVTEKIATSLQSAAKTAQSDGNTSGASRLNQLATDFSNASQTGQLPNVQDLAKAIGGHAQHRARPESDSDSASTSNTTTGTATSSANSSNTSQLLNQLLTTLQTTGPQNDSVNPMAIITKTMSNSGISNV